MRPVFPALDLMSRFPAIPSFASVVTNVWGSRLSPLDRPYLVGPTAPCPHPYVAATASHNLCHCAGALRYTNG